MTLICPACLQEYNFIERIPHVIPCGHSICSKCLTTNEKCSACDQEYVPSECPVNYCVKDQILSKSGESNRGQFSWKCSLCFFNLQPNQARICVKCLPKSIAENSVGGLIIHKPAQAEVHLICAHCSLESAHSSHITLLYLPAKKKKFVEEKTEELLEIISKPAFSAKEVGIMKDAIVFLKEESLKTNGWVEFEKTWIAAEVALEGLAQTNARIREYEDEIYNFQELIQRENSRKHDLQHLLTCAVTGVEPDSPLSSDLCHSDSDTSSPVSIRRFEAVSDLSTSL